MCVTVNKAMVKFCFIQVLDALNGKQGMVECAFVQSDVCNTGYFASPVELGVCLDECVL